MLATIPRTPPARRPHCRRTSGNVVRPLGLVDVCPPADDPGCRRWFKDDVLPAPRPARGCSHHPCSDRRVRSARPRRAAGNASRMSGAEHRDIDPPERIAPIVSSTRAPDARVRESVPTISATRPHSASPRPCLGSASIHITAAAATAVCHAQRSLIIAASPQHADRPYRPSFAVDTAPVGARIIRVRVIRLRKPPRGQYIARYHATIRILACEVRAPRRRRQQ